MIWLFLSACYCREKIRGYFNVFVPEQNHVVALAIVKEQFGMIVRSQLLARSEQLTVNVVTKNEAAKSELPFAGDNVKVNFFSSGFEEVTLDMMQKDCVYRSESVYYIHSKGAYTQTHENTLMRHAMMNVVVSKWNECFLAIVQDKTDVCGLRFSPFPHAHFAGNFWWSHCAHIERLVPTATFSNFLSIDAPDCHDYSCGRRRCGTEHWVTSHPLTRTYDCLQNHEYIHSYEYLEDMNEFRCVPAPRSHLSPHAIKSRLKHRFFHNYASGAESCLHTLAEYNLIHPNVSLSELSVDTIGSWMQMCARTCQ